MLLFWKGAYWATKPTANESIARAKSLYLDERNDYDPVQLQQSRVKTHCNGGLRLQYQQLATTVEGHFVMVADELEAGKSPCCDSRFGVEISNF